MLCYKGSSGGNIAETSISFFFFFFFFFFVLMYVEFSSTLHGLIHMSLEGSLEHMFGSKFHFHNFEFYTGLIPYLP